MAKPLRSQLNQIRAWVRQGRTDAWIAHQLEVSTSELREFRRRHELSAEDDSGEEPDLRDEIEAEIEAATREEELAAEAEEEDEDDEEADDAGRRRLRRGRSRRRATRAKPAATSRSRRRRRRRRRRGGRGRSSRPGAGMQATFDHGKDDGYGLWLDPAIADDPIYTEHWAGKRRIEVTVEPDRIIIKRSDADRRRQRSPGRSHAEHATLARPRSAFFRVSAPLAPLAA